MAEFDDDYRPLSFNVMDLLTDNSQLPKRNSVITDYVNYFK